GRLSIMLQTGFITHLPHPPPGEGKILRGAREAASGSLLLLFRFELGDVLLGVFLELIAAAGAADVVGLALVGDGHGATAAGDDALRITVAARGEWHPFLGRADLKQLGE